jgi:hypothetical protein
LLILLKTKGRQYNGIAAPLHALPGRVGFPAGARGNPFHTASDV